MSTAPRSERGPLLPAPFVVACVVLVLAAAVGHPILLARVGSIEKKEVPLKAPLSQMAKEGLGPYRFKASYVLPAAVADALGAQDHLDWQFLDTSIEDATNPVSWIRVMVAYHTGGVDVVPHTPDQCYLGQGYQPVNMENTEIEIPSMGRSIPIRVLKFVRSELHGGEEPTVIYFFHCNGEFVETRTKVRDLVNSLSTGYAYHCKIQLTFGSETSRPTYASREDSIAAAAKFLDYFLPILVKDHLPDWDAVLAQEQASEKAAAK